MSLVGSQQKVFLRLVATLRPHWRRDRDFPNRVQALFAANRSFGSRDRKLYRELIYTTLRFLPWIEPLLDADPARAVKIAAWLSADSPATQSFRAAVCGDWPACPPTVAAKAAHLGVTAIGLLPDWVERHCPAACVPPDLDALHTRAPLWLRLQRTADSPRALDEFTSLGWTWRRSEVLPTAVEIPSGADVTKTAAWRDGAVEVQDLGSQLVLHHAGISPGAHWLDACAGAGGKTLQLATLLGPGGKIDAHDIRPEALRELAARATRARIALRHPLEGKSAPAASARLPTECHPMGDTSAAAITILSAAPSGLYDGVLVDAPCSGSGTWRRSPHLKWTTTPGAIARSAETQRDLLSRLAQHVRPGGQLVYATCSLSHVENEDVIAAFLGDHSDFTAERPARTILPAEHNTDGFFVAPLRRR